jgi:hypothetical protein
MEESKVMVLDEGLEPAELAEVMACCASSQSSLRTGEQ